jgi:hypothetical protein
MSRNQEMFDMITRWIFRGSIVVASSLISLFVHSMMTDIEKIQLDVQTIKEDQSTQKEQIKNLERITYKLR